jgi:hypothetical protein
MTDIITRASGPTVPDTYVVSADQDTIIGDGTTYNPLRAGPGGSSSTFTAAYRGGSAVPGTPVFISFVSEPGGITTVQLTVVNPASPLTSNFNAFAAVHGVVSAVNDDGTVQVQTSGLLTLTTDQWDQVTEGSGGLVMGETYYASRSITSTAFLSDDPDTTPGTFTTRVGVALTSQILLIDPSAPVQNLGDLIVFATFAGQPLNAGSAVIVSSANHVAAATSDVSVTAAQAIGVIAAFDVNGQPIVQIGGVVTLTTAEWDAITDTSPGMVPGDAYYVDTSANPGHLTASAPTTGAKVQLGVGLSSTQMVIAPYLQRLS